jgi:hypothetical protein
LDRELHLWIRTPQRLPGTIERLIPEQVLANAFRQLAIDFRQDGVNRIPREARDMVDIGHAF